MASEDNKMGAQPPETDKTANGEGWELVAEGDWLAGQRFKISGHAVLGRDSSCDITIPGTHLSRRHAELAITGKKLLIRDLGSSNGTYVNNKRVTETELLPGDTIQFDVLIFRIHGPSQESDINATMIRQVPPTVKKAKLRRASASPAENKQWKTKPTSVGNRDQTVHMTAAQKAGRSASIALYIVVGLVALAGLGYLFTQL